MPSISLPPLQHMLLVLVLLNLSHLTVAFFPDAEDVNMDFLKKDPKAGPDLDRMMLMNTEDPKLRAEAEEAFQEIMRARRLSKLQECRRDCVNEHESAEDFARCNAGCEATQKPGEYAELPTLRGSGDGEKQATKQPEEKAKEEKIADEDKTEKPSASGEL